MCVCGLQRDTAVSSNCPNRAPPPYSLLPSPVLSTQTRLPALMCQSRFARVIIILATILRRLHSVPLDIFQLSQEVRDGGAATATDHEEDFLI